ncbi:MAG: hypothetical protein COS97_03325 [Candidatus Nealsonbacteria bacterium CG07_land_8_20_14_0_80_40_10]|nr:MAG: hypothetical protein COS97_03325 [Candidatus Nealsonbacteria bacterium CG07_land_8_20_14_0_80_40_10]
MKRIQKYKIAQVAPTWVRVPPVDYGGAEFIISHLTENLFKRGYDVTLFASGDSLTQATLISNIDKAAGLGVDNLADLSKRMRYYKTILDPLMKEYKFDLIHWHVSYDLLPYFIAQLSTRSPAVVTFHNHYPNIADLLKEETKSFNVSVSYAFQKELPIKFSACIYNGIRLEDFDFVASGQKNQLVWIGRFTPVKGADLAIRMADQLKVPITIAAPVRENQYYTEIIQPALKRSNYAQFIGPINLQRKNKILGQAKVFINPILWDEPFGLVVPESNACGTPVVAFAKGAMPELIRDGVNGFLVKPDDIKGMVGAVQRIYEMPEEQYQAMRRACRKHVEENFPVEKMVDGYEKVYQRVIEDWRGKHGKSQV